jgi:molybdenum cofactor guanylyltransferase
MSKPNNMANTGTANTIAAANITGLILAGGRGSRMGLVDKGLQTLQGKTMVAHVLARLSPQVAGVLINANQNQTRYQNFGWPVIGDVIDGFAGPLAGMHSGMQHCQTDYLLSVPCDSPFLPLDLVSRLLAAMQQQKTEVAVATTLENGHAQVQPVFCLMKTTLLPHLAGYLAQGGRKIDAWYRDLPVARVMFDDLDAFRNLNTLEELQQAQGAPHPSV